MLTDLAIRAPLGLLPVLIFLVVLLYLDSYKLVNFRMILRVIFACVLLAIAAYWANGYLIAELGWDRSLYFRYGAPLVEEALKAFVMVYLFRTHRIGFLVDSAILGFAVGAGFGVVENFFYLYLASDAHIAVWIVRGFGTAIMHGGTMALFGVMAQLLTERSMKINPLWYLPGFAVAVAIHSLFNHFPGTPILTTLGTILVLPPVFWIVFVKSANAMHEWLEVDFDEDADLLQQINSGQFADSKIGIFLGDLRQRFDGPTVVDMLCYLRLYTELALRAKGVLMMRENGLDTPVGERTREKFEE
ncbi:MAG: PrsW family glutamic-type intramembrane protease, partial [Lysobacterales bacterium]